MDDIINRIDSEIIDDNIQNVAFDRRDEFKIRYLGSRLNHWVTFWVCFFLGGLGIHKFYLRKPIIGFIYLGAALVRIYIKLTPYNLDNSTLAIIYMILNLFFSVFVLLDIFTFKMQTKEANKQIAIGIVEEMNSSQNIKDKDIV